jgi:hypothetical protein
MKDVHADLDSAAQVWRELGRVNSATELLDVAHRLWCGPGCDEGLGCAFLHYPRTRPPAAPPRSPASRYTRRTAELFGLMGGEGYRPDTPQVHAYNLWPMVREISARIDTSTAGKLDYTDWSKKHATSATELCLYICRDVLQWMALWCGDHYDHQPAALHYVALSSIVDDLCIPPLDLVTGRFRLYQRSAADVAVALDVQGWGRHGVQAMLALARQYILQHAEKTHPALHATLNALDGVWDAVIYRTYTANTYGAAIVIEQVCDQVVDLSEVTWTWRMDSAICDAISMDLAKSAALDVYHVDDHQPTAHDQHVHRRKIGYHSLYLDLIDDLVTTGAPDPLVHFGRSGFLFVPLVERYPERRNGRRHPLRPAMQARLHDLFGDTPADRHIDDAFKRH